MDLVNQISLKLTRKRLPASSVILSQKNIYIFPSKIGFAYLLLLAIMLLTAINYQNSLVYLFTFLLGGIFFVSIWLCFLNVSGMVLSSGKASDCYTGEEMPFEISLSRQSSPAIALQFALKKYWVNVDGIDANSSGVYTLLAPPKARGVYGIERLYMHSYFPFGLIRAWTWQQLDAKAYVFPKPIDGTEFRSLGDSMLHDENVHESDELSDLKPYQQGDSTKRVVWKRYAARDELVTREREHSSFDSSWVRWDDYDQTSKELRLSYMCFDILRLSSQHAKFGLVLPGKAIQPALGELHKTACLRALAEF